MVLGTIDEGAFYLMHCTGHGQVDSYTARRFYCDATIDILNNRLRPGANGKMSDVIDLLMALHTSALKCLLEKKNSLGSQRSE